MLLILEGESPFTANCSVWAVSIAAARETAIGAAVEATAAWHRRM